MKEPHLNALAALDAFWNVVREKADHDAAFAAKLVTALSIPIQFHVDTPPDAEGYARIASFIEPRVVAKQGEVRFREIFSAFTDAQKKGVIRNFNLASPDAITGKRGAALVDIMWEAAASQAKRMADR
jgi:hypothetical protein